MPAKEAIPSDYHVDIPLRHKGRVLWVVSEKKWAGNSLLAITASITASKIERHGYFGPVISSAHDISFQIK